MSNHLTVDIDEFKMWLEGELLHFEHGVGMVVNELEAMEAEEALERGEEVLCRKGARLTGTKLIKRGNGIMEV
jgi:hypothetical protein